ncbi:TVP38/TMEM64 family protein [Cytobacillus firmus]|uniref:TVP38/TMEM64 family protein n=1 Tax=Cytobacillus firmus TaxID=1399 RepID=UPI0015801FEC|nr:VTT domain-containing protein [Cytobacillus firmus]MBG9546287.1 SNARE associated Golgi protein [Cytobacillus firmus]MBG9600769.1 SNARE associated Golgi protein [Cytobacillus firmus]MBG9654657.1 SNARE associated Golgi protein [Cytobacillus firmus]MDD9314073.1 VTT domain-containing protein [Cytobacillus firmus]MED1905523.1 VTT domain-containing protein [Cytobacillus firmus]
MNGKIEVSLHGLIILKSLYILFNFMPTLLPAYKWVIITGMAAILVMDFYFISAGRLSRLKYSRLALIYMFSLLFIVFITFYLTKILVLTDAYGLESILREYEAEGKLIFFLVCFLQPILLPLPEAVTLPAGSAVFGPAAAAFLGFTGTISGIIVMFWTARIGGLKLVSRFIKERHLIKYQKYMEKNENTILIMLFVIPILPDEIICVGAGMGGVSFKKFLGIASISKMATSLLLAYSLSLADALSLSGSQLLLVVSVVIGVFYSVSFMYKKRERNYKNCE